MPRHRLLLGLFLVGFAAICRAGGGPENVLLVVNQNSHDSLTIANHYVQLRKIPALNVVYLDWKGGDATCTGEEFREQILKPLIEQINERRIAAQIDYIVYSTGFPWRIDLREDLDTEKLPKQFSPYASITGATYLWPYVLQKNEAIVIPEVNYYVPPPARVNVVRCQQLDGVQSRAFRSRYAWTAQRDKTTDFKRGQRYFISSVLGVTVERGNTVDEIVGYLRTAAKVDGHGKQGTFYFMRRGRHPRTTPRQDCFETVARQMRAEGATVEILEGELPDGRQVQGLMTGVGRYDLQARGVTIAPGAFCDDLTSYGAEFSNGAQTKLSEFLRAGAAGSSGTVIEPYNIQAKFPLPSLHLHYFRGCSLGEAFYQSVQGPYQILFVGDPLCQPWAKPPEVAVNGVEPDQRVSGTIEVRTQVTPAVGTPSGLCELFVDGRLVVPKPFPPPLPIPIDTDQLGPGRHEIRVVAATGDDLEMQGRVVVEFDVASDDSQLVTIAIEPKPFVPRNGQLTISVAAPQGTTGIDILQNRRVVGHIEGASGSVTLPAIRLGRGPVGLSAEATTEEGKVPVRSQVFSVFVE